MNDYKQDNTLSIIAIVLGGLAIVLSLIPCLFFLSIPLAIIGLILGIIAYFKAKDNGDKKTMSIVAMCIPLLAFIISAVWYFTFSSFTGEENSKYIYIDNCDSLKVQIDKSIVEIEELEEELEESDEVSGVFGKITKVTKIGIKLSKLQDNAKDLGCDFKLAGDNIEVDSLNENIEVEVDSEGLDH